MSDKILHTVIGRFHGTDLPVNVHTHTYRHESERNGELYRVVSKLYPQVTDHTQILIPLTPNQARVYAAWLLAEADYADHMNGGVVEADPVDLPSPPGL